MADICIYTHNAREFFLITQKFRAEGLRFVALDTLDDIPPKSKVLLTAKADLVNFPFRFPKSLKLVEIGLDESPNQIYLKTLQYYHNRKSFRSLIVAIDPGSKVSGLAVFLDEAFMLCKEFYNVVEMQRYINEIFSIFPNHRKILKIGNGILKLTKNVLDVFRKYSFSKDEVDCIIVNENFTSKKPIRGKFKAISRHENAARIIGRRSGLLVPLNYLD